MESHNMRGHLPIDEKMNKTNLRKASVASTTLMVKLSKEQSTTTGILRKICKVLDYDFANIMEADKSDETNIDGEEINVRH
ncbi:MAG: helix-turn-helix domain-containing protein [Candidatus Bathyarchaeota archaeon]|jgi:DNA-binding Xre family transcriptional regulator|nr:helix-turn-helix domain-containing protein [Candidatus Termitimicrobium sp.]